MVSNDRTMSGNTWPRRSNDLTPEDAALVDWAGPGFPPSLAPLAARLARSGFSVLDVNHGWWPLVKRLDHDVSVLAPRYRVDKFGEDLGVLDFRVAPADAGELIEGLVSDAQAVSIRTCEICADRAWLYRDGDWLVTLCVDHARARGARPARTDADIADAAPRPNLSASVLAESASTCGADTNEPRPPPAKVKTGSERNAVTAGRQLSPWAAIVGPCYASASLGQVLSLSGAEISAAAAGLRLLRLRTKDDVVLFPAFQVRDGSVHPDLPRVLSVLRSGIEDPWTWAQWLNAPDVNGVKPIEQLWNGELADVLQEARHDARAWSL